MVLSLSTHKNLSLSQLDVQLHDILEFLGAIEACGKSVPTKVQDHPDRPVDVATANVSFEARQIKQLYVKLRQ